MSEKLIPAINESVERKNKWEEVLESINLKEYLGNDDYFIKQFKEFYFELRNSNPRGTYNIFLEKFTGKKLELDYNFYNEKYFNYKRNIEKQIFKQFIYFLNNKIGTQLSLKEYKENALLKYKEKIWNESCPVHKDNIPLKEEINEEIFCRCIVTYEAEYNF